MKYKTFHFFNLKDRLKISRNFINYFKVKCQVKVKLLFLVHILKEMKGIHGVEENSALE